MTFGEAIEAMKNGSRVSRSGWNGKKMWVALTPGSVIDAHSTRGAAALVAAEHGEGENLRGRKITIGAHIDMRAADGSLVIGWLASQTDMLADDWSVVE